jgi:hypothetical protein
MVVTSLGSLSLVAVARPSTPLRAQLDDQERPKVSSPLRVWLSIVERALAIISCIVPFDRELASTNDKAFSTTLNRAPAAHHPRSQDVTKTMITLEPGLKKPHDLGSKLYASYLLAQRNLGKKLILLR